MTPEARLLSPPTRPFFAKEESTTEQDNEDETAVRQVELNAMMQDQQSGALFAKQQDDKVTYNAIPLFTGTVILLASIFITGYGFYVFATGSDPIFLSNDL
jgi:hypothetical protein